KCGQTVASRTSAEGHECTGTFPVAVSGKELAGDVNPLGISGLGGNVEEFTLGSGLPYDDPCYRGAGVLDPLCVEPTCPVVISRGGGWSDPLAFTRTTQRWFRQLQEAPGDVGFRCVYARRPGSP